MLRKSLTGSIAIIASFFFLTNVQAAQFKTFGDYVIHYNAISTQILLPKVARANDIVRSKNRALLNISVRKKASEGEMHDKAVSAAVTVTATNLTQQLSSVKMRRVQEQDAVYYIGVFTIANEEVLDFNIQVDPEEKGTPHVITFRQQFFVD